jgi:hypothetical protein
MLPSLENANSAVEKIHKKYIAELKAMNNPHQDTHRVLMAVMTLLGESTAWRDC